MMLQIPEVLTKAQVADLRRLIDAGAWVDGNVTSGAQSALAKRNEQLPEASPEARQAGERILDDPDESPEWGFELDLIEKPESEKPG